jgi:beta,beta-carotene 9',10'-dioxygenase
VNAFERDGEVVVDLIAYEDASIIDMLELERLRDPAERPPFGRLRRCRIPLDGGDVRTEPLADVDMDLPRISYRTRNERSYRYVYGAGLRDADSEWLDQVVKVDVTTGDVRRWFEDGSFAGEPVFVPAPHAEAEDDGVVLSVVLDPAAERSFVVALDAASFEELGRAEAPHHIPFGFHGQFFPQG